ncbi:MAG: hypothetical protein AEth_02055 [Candidatus Argoarchaeum ethanivorans]|uniref:Formylmethanofuran dehydrogenase subunit E domain-containing protein n=1 Tax=Candidatus Argoarchaeum ethanivorans TaxID=2608793 RepID=A0A8B3S059_9EURY|nr:MAG: hypothetical protein AEth_02055 [Candidatus Argoarchaeum ethanivorans]
MRDTKSGMNFRVATLVIMSILALSLTIAVDAHMPGAKPLPDFELTPIVINDGKTEMEIAIEDIGKYHGDICVCGSCAFRATQLGISQIWGDEVPAGDDIRIINRLPTPGSKDCFQYITGQGIETNTKGEYKMILPDATVVANMTKKNLKKLSKHVSTDYFRFDVCRISTGECFEVAVEEQVFPDGYFELRKKVKFGIPENATSEEKALFKSDWETIRERDF